jgi:hypothetical protein
MYETLIQAFFGWPAMIFSLLFAIAGILLKRVSLSVMGAILFVLPGWYLSQYSVVFALATICLFGSAYAIQKHNSALAAWLVAPQLMVLIALAIVVLNQ